MTEVEDGCAGRSECGEESGDVGFEGRCGAGVAPVGWMCKALLDVDQDQPSLPGRDGFGHDAIEQRERCPCVCLLCSGSGSRAN